MQTSMALQKVETVQDIINGINTVLEKNSSSFTDVEVQSLRHAKAILENSSEPFDFWSKENIELATQIVQALMIIYKVLGGPGV